MRNSRGNRRSRLRRLQARRRNIWGPNTLGFETLEDRVLLAADVSRDAMNKLVVTDTDNSNDNLSIELSGTGSDYIIENNSQLTLTGDLAGLGTGSGTNKVTVPVAAITANEFIINASGGSDSIRLSNLAGKTGTLNGGTGDDTYKLDNNWGLATINEGVSEGNDTLDFTGHTGTLTVTGVDFSSSDGSTLSQPGEKAEEIDKTVTEAFVSSAFTGLQDFIDKMPDAGGELAKLSNQLPLLDRGLEGGLADVAGLVAAFETFVTQANSAIAGATKLSDVTTAINGLVISPPSPLDSLVVSVGTDYRGADPQASGPVGQLELLLDFDLQATVEDELISIDLGEDADNLGININADVKVDASLDSKFQLGLSTDLTNFFLVPDGSLTLKVDAKADFSAPVSVNLGLLELSIEGGSIALDGQVKVELQDDANGDERIALGQQPSTTTLPR